MIDRTPGSGPKNDGKRPNNDERVGAGTYGIGGGSSNSTETI